jgi:hypothetical protein
MAVQYKSVKVPAWAYDNAQLVLADLVRNGTDRIPTALRTPEIEALIRQGPTLTLVIALGIEALRQRVGSAGHARRPRATHRAVARRNGPRC